MKKSLIILSVSLAILCSLLAGCGNNDLNRIQKSPLWDNATVKNNPIQIGDIFMVPADTVGDIYEKTQQSELDWTWENDMDELENGNNNINIYLNGTPWIELYCRSGSETKKLRDCSIAGAFPANEKALKHSWFMDGRTYDDITNMTYDDVKDLKNTFFANPEIEYRVTETEVDENGGMLYVGKPLDRLKIRYEPRADFSNDKDVYQEYLFYVDKKTGKVIDFKMSHHS